MQHITRKEAVFVATVIAAIGNDNIATDRYGDAADCLENAVTLLHKIDAGEKVTVEDARHALLDYETEWRDSVVETFAMECVDEGKQELLTLLAVFIDDAACDKFVARYKEMA